MRLCSRRAERRPLAAPVPGPDGQADPRDATMRAYDAVITALSRGLVHPGAPALVQDKDLTATVNGAITWHL